MPATTSTTLASDVRTFIAQETLMIAERALRFYQFGVKAKLPEQFGTTFQYTRYNRLALPVTTLTEGTAPAAQTLGITVVTAQAQQWGGIVTITDVAELTIAHRPLIKAIELLGYQAAETIDREIHNVLSSTTNINYLGAAASRAAMATTSVTETDIRRMVAELRNNGAMGLEPAEGGNEDPVLGDNFVGIIDPFVEMDLQTLSGWISSVQYQDAKRMWNGEAGTYAGVRFIRSNHIPTLTRGASVTTVTAVTAGGSMAGASGAETSYRVRMVITGVDTQTQYERVIYDHTTVVLNASTAMGSATNTGAINVTVPTVTGFVYNIYITNPGSAAASTDTARLANGGSRIAAAGQATVTAFSSSGALVPAALNSASDGVHLCYFLGKEAYTVVNLENLRSYLTPATESDSDPLLQRRTAGWKVFFRAVINNNDFLGKLEVPSAHD